MVFPARFPRITAFTPVGRRLRRNRARPPIMLEGPSLPPTSPEPAARPVRKLMAANRSEIAIRVFRSAHELGIRTVAIYAHAARSALPRFRADGAHRLGNPGEPLRAYLDIEGIVAPAVEREVDAIHPGYGFLSENAAFACACAQAGLIFVGPRPEVLDQLGDKL